MTAIPFIQTAMSDRLSAMISSLSDIQSRLQQLRNAPPLLLKSSMPFSTSSIRQDFHHLKELADTIRSDAVQDALRAATNSEKADKSDLNRNGRREMRKRRQAFLSSSRSTLMFVLDVRLPQNHPSLTFRMIHEAVRCSLWGPMTHRLFQPSSSPITFGNSIERTPANSIYGHESRDRRNLATLLLFGSRSGTFWCATSPWPTLQATLH